MELAKQKELLSIAIKAAFEAGRAIMQVYDNEDFEVDFKSDNSPLTKADRISHQIIVENLKVAEIPVLSEEGRTIPFEERRNWSLLWIVDPIDGTKEFIKRNGEFTVNIALVKEQVPILGVVYAPAINELYFSSNDLGAFLYQGHEELSLEELMNASSLLPMKKPEIYTVVASRSHMSPETEDYVEQLKQKHGEVDLISKGSSLKLCMVAKGEANCYPRFAPTMEWDTAAGQAICLGAKIRVIDWMTKENMLYNREELLNNWFLVY